MEVPVVRTVADTLAADMPAVDTAAVEVTAAADTEADAKCFVSSPFQPESKALLARERQQLLPFASKGRSRSGL
jgi:hypothetical protein